MSWVWAQSEGGMYWQAACFGRGYSGNGSGRNNPAQESVHSVGPIPRGEWTIEGPPFTHPTAGPNVLRLVPKPGTNTYGRAGFLIHGDNPTHTASEGCIVLPPQLRVEIWESNDRDLVVQEDPPTVDDDATPTV